MDRIPYSWQIVTLLASSILVSSAGLALLGVPVWAIIVQVFTSKVLKTLAGATLLAIGIVGFISVIVGTICH